MRSRIDTFTGICLNFSNAYCDSLTIDLGDQKRTKQLRRNDIRRLFQINQRWRSLATSPSS